MTLTKRAIIVGGSSGVGQGIAGALDQRGWNVLVGDLNPPKIGSDAIRFLPVDACDEQSVARFADKVSEFHSAIDLLIITIGAIDERPLSETSTSALQWILEVNLLASKRVVDALMPLLEAADQPRIVLTSSGSGLGYLESGGAYPAYAIAKQAMLGYFRCLRAELAPTGTNVSLLLPTGIAGELAANSATLRVSALNSPFEPERGAPQRQLLDAAEMGESFVEQILSGATIVTNAPSKFAERIMRDVEELRHQLGAA